MLLDILCQLDHNWLYPRYGGGGRPQEDEDTRLRREHWDYIDGLREIQVQVADDIRGARTISIPLDMPLPEGIAVRAMRGTVQALTTPARVVDILDDPIALMMLALLIDESDE